MLAFNASSTSLPSSRVSVVLTDDELCDLLDAFERQGVSNCDDLGLCGFDKNADENGAHGTAFSQENKAIESREGVSHQCAITLTPLERYNRYLKQQAEHNLLNALTEAERRKQAEEEEMQQAMRVWRDEQNRKTFSAENSGAVTLGLDASCQSSGRPSSRQPRKKDASVDTFTRKRWRDLTAAQKLSVASREASNKGGTAFNLNLSPAREASLLASKDLRGDLRDLVSTSLRKFGRADLPVAFILEANDAGRLHLHGVIGAQLSDEERQSLRKAMCEVFGEDAGMKRVRQMNTKPLHDAAGWSDYMLKDQKQTERLLGISAEDQVFLNQAMTRLASGAFDEMRRSRPRRKSVGSIAASFLVGLQIMAQTGWHALSAQFSAPVRTC